MSLYQGKLQQCQEQHCPVLPVCLNNGMYDCQQCLELLTPCTEMLMHVTAHRSLYRHALSQCKRVFSEVIPGFTVQELCESRGGHPGLSVLTSFMVSKDVKQS